METPKAMTHVDGVLYVAQSERKHVNTSYCECCAFHNGGDYDRGCKPANANASDGDSCNYRIWVRSEDQSPTAWATYWLLKE